MMIKIFKFKKPKITLITEKYEKLINSSVYKSVKKAEDDLKILFDKEAVNCKYFISLEKKPIGRFCKKRKGNLCDISVCPK